MTSPASITTEDGLVVIPAYQVQDKMALVGKVIALMLDSEAYLAMSLYSIKKSLIGSIYKDQALIIVENSKVIAFASWAFLNEEAEQRMLEGQVLEVTEWNSGDRPWLVNVVSPYRDPTFLVQYIREWATQLGFKGKKVKFTRYDEETQSYNIREVAI
jgi:cytolysin-activating lysine-acyltransferase